MYCECDFDDKIINRVQENSVYDKYIDELVDEIASGNLDILDEIKKDNIIHEVEFDNIEYLVRQKKIKKEGLNKFLSNNKFKKNLLKRFYTQYPDIEIDENEYYRLTKNMESEFWSDMDSLNIKRPSVITRAIEYIPKIIGYIEKIEDNGFAYESNGSVYFDSQAFTKAGYNMNQLHQCFENEYTESTFIGEKKHKYDFVLWKKAKPGEIKFDSKWSKGRIGWHSECVVMASDILGDNFDIHSGGIDLKFPHHNNEVVQAIAYQNEKITWANTFLHVGHLNIDGEKMAKSLYNFVTIQNYLKNMGTARQLRILFLLHKWNMPLDFNDDTFNESVLVDKRINDFLNNMEYLYTLNIENKTSHSRLDNIYKSYIFESKRAVEKHLRDNVNTSSVMKRILDIINKTNIYTTEPYAFNMTNVDEMYHYVTKILTMFGLDYTSNKKESKSDSNWIDLSVNLRYEVRNVLLNNKKQIEKDTFKKIFNILDDYRDNKMLKLGVKLEDKGKNDPTKWNYI